MTTTPTPDALPVVAYWIPKAEQFCLPPSDGTKPFAKQWEPLCKVSDALAAIAARSTPPGWVTVPREPTDAMAVAAIKASLRNPAINGVAIYRAMLAAAPLPPTGGWQDIATAPKDGTTLIGWVVAEKTAYSNAFAAPSLIKWDKGFKSSICERKPGWEKQWRGEVTHWAPLPPEPTGDDK